MSTTELSEPALDGPAPAKSKLRRKLPGGGPFAVLVVVLVVAISTALVVAIGLSVYPGSKPKAAPVVHAAVLPPTPVLTPLPIGQAAPGCFDSRSALDALVVCPADLAGRWAYDGGLVQAEGRGAPECLTPGAATPTAWVNLSSATLHLREQVVRRSSVSVARAEVRQAEGAGPAALCTNLTVADQGRVTPQPLAIPAGASAAEAWQMPSEGRTWTMVLVAVDRAVLRLDVTAMNAPAPPTAADVDDLASAAVLRYLAALPTSAAPGSTSGPSAAPDLR